MDFQGFQNILPPALIIVIVFGLFILAWVSYRNFKSISSFGRWVLIFLRGFTLTLLLLLLLNPYFYSSEEIELKPNIAVFLDNSESIGITKGNYNGLESYKNLLNTLNFEQISEAEIKYFSIGEGTEAFHPDSLAAAEPQTNLSDPVEALLEMEQEVQAAILISDGIITFGKNPSINASHSSIPIYSIALGDTSRVKDISVSNVLTNTTGYTKTNHVVEAEISQSGFANNTINISLIAENETLESRQITFEADDQVKQLEFVIELEEPGLKQFEVRVEPLPDEWTASNNSRVFSIDVLDSKVKILHVAFEIHPDVKAIRSIISQDVNNELSTLTWLGGNRFIEEIPGDNEFSLIIIHGAPTASREFEFFSLLSETPVIYFETPSFSNVTSGILNEYKIISRRTNQVSQINLYPLLNADEHPVLDIPEINLREIPLLLSPVRSNLSAVQVTSLFAVNFNGVNTDSPALAVLEQGNIRRSHMMPWGWYRIIQSTNASHREFATELISNLIAWTASNPDNRKLRVLPSKQIFSTSESPILNGSLQNERGDPEDKGIIEVEITYEEGSTKTFNMDNSGNGNYRMNLPRHSEGLYRYTATARKGEREIESQNGEFLVSNSSSELTNTIRNDELMKSIAVNSGGNAFTYNNVNGFWDSLRVANILESRTELIENYSFPVRSFLWFAVVLLFLGAEWILRKYYSLP